MRAPALAALYIGLGITSTAAADCRPPSPPWYRYIPTISASMSATGEAAEPRLAVLWSPADVLKVRESWAQRLRPAIQDIAKLRATAWMLRVTMERARLGLADGAEIASLVAEMIEIRERLAALEAAIPEHRKWIKCVLADETLQPPQELDSLGLPAAPGGGYNEGGHSVSGGDRVHLGRPQLAGAGAGHPLVPVDD